MKEGWTVHKLGDVFSLNYGKPLAREDRYEAGRFAAYGANRIKCRTDRFLVDGPGIVVGRKGSAGEITLVGEPFWPLDVTYFVEHDPSAYDRTFLFHLLKSLELPKLADGVKPGINRNDVYKISRALPPLAEQKRIVAILDEAFEGTGRAVANTQKTLAAARELFESHLNIVVLREHEESTTDKLGQFCERITVGHVGPMKDRYVESGIPFLRSQNVRPFELSEEGLKYIDEGFNDELRKSALKPGDVAIVRTGYPGTAAVVPNDFGVCNCVDLVIATPGPNLLPDFMSMLLNSRFGKEVIAGNLTGAAQKHLNVGAAKAVRVSIPPISVQRGAVAEFKSIQKRADWLTVAIEKKLGSLANLKQSTLHRAFSGDLTAAPDKTLAELGA